ncbi:hypothetical protein HanIR_Chr04g0168001 [Helianthus annuus]|nr:hypothetical protein HanIR_Chr04g0168001 [Helianthus annuus]
MKFTTRRRHRHLLPPPSPPHLDQILGFEDGSEVVIGEDKVVKVFSFGGHVSDAGGCGNLGWLFPQTLLHPCTHWGWYGLLIWVFCV